MPDRNIKCADCQKEFVFSEGEQAFFAQKQFTDPRRCKPCRDAKRAAKNERKFQQNRG